MISLAHSNQSQPTDIMPQLTSEPTAEPTSEGTFEPTYTTEASTQQSIPLGTIVAYADADDSIYIGEITKYKDG